MRLSLALLTRRLPNLGLLVLPEIFLRLQHLIQLIYLLSNGAVRRMRTRIRLQAQPEPMRSIVGAIQQEQRFD